MIFEEITLIIQREHDIPSLRDFLGRWVKILIDRKLNYGRHNLDEFAQHLNDVRNVLDIGAGYGDDLSILSNYFPEAELFGIEFNKLNADELRSKGVIVFESDIEFDIFPFSDNSVDVVIANQVIEHTKNIFWIFHEISRILPVGGHIFLGLPNIAALHNRLLLLFGRQPTQIKSASAHVRGFTRYDVLGFFEEVFPGGYQLKIFRGSNFYPFPPVVARPLARIFPNSAWGIFFMLEKIREYDNQFIEYPVRKRLETNFFVG